MQYLITLSIRPDADAAEVEAARIPSSKALWNLYMGGVIREMYTRQDNTGVVFMAEAASAEALNESLSSLPFLQSGLLVGEAVALVPFADLALAFQ